MDASVITSSPLLSSARNESPVIPASALATGATLKEYVITGVIGEGGFGIVYAALDTLLQRNVAIKEYMPAAIANRLTSAQINLRSQRHQQTFAAGMQGFIDEARLLAQFKHSSLVEILRFWEANGTAYMVMPHYSGKTLRNILKQDRNQCTEAWLKSILAPILDATDLLHSNHIYHRDIAPDNIVIQDNGQPVLLDLGSARRVIAGMQSALTVVVKPGYAPIEQYTEDTANEQGPWTDIYALGAVLYFAITGAAPTASVSRMMRDTLKHLTRADYPNYSEGFLNAINCALRLRPAERHQNITEFREALNLSTVYTGNIAVPLPTPINQDRASKTPIEHSHDDEITQILSEDEIEQFKEKLLQTLSGEKTEQQQEKIIQKLDENILINKAKQKNQSNSTFDDVRELLAEPLANKNNSTPKIKGSNIDEKKLVVENNKPTTTKTNSSTKNWPKYLPVGMAGIALVVAVITTIWLTNTTSESTDGATEATSNSNTSNTGDATQLVAQQSISEQLTVIPPDSEASGGSTVSTTDTETQPGATVQNNLSESLIDATVNAPDTNTISVQSNSYQADPETTVGETQAITETVQSKKPEKSKTDAKSSSNLTADIITQGTAKITLVPWGEIWIDSQRYGVSPPVRELSLAPGTYNVELRNPGLPTETRSITIQKGDNTAIYHNFTTPQKSAAAALKVEEQTQPATTTGNNNQQKITAKIKTEEHSKANANKDQPLPSQQKTAITTERILNIKVLPWGEIFVDGDMVGVTPPLHQIKLSPGAHVIEIRHPSYTSKTIQISAADAVNDKLEHRFK